MRLTCWIVAKSTNIPCAVSGRRYTVFSASSIGPMFVLNMRWKLRGWVNAVCPQFGHDRAGPRAVVGAEPLVAVQALDERVGEDLEVPEASQTFGDMITAASSPTTSSRSWTIERHHCSRTLRLSSVPSGP